MSFATPLGLFALLGIPTVLFLHLFRRRLQQRRVAGLFLFSPDALAAQSGRRRSRLLRTASLWLELAAALLLSLWLGGFTLGAVDPPVHFVVVLDDSASMSARGPQGTVTADRARGAVLEAAEKLPNSSKVTLITTGRRPQITLGPRAPLGQLRAALQSYAPSRSAHDIQSSLDLGRELAEGGELLFVTDLPSAGAPPEYRVRAVGRAFPNTAILSARRAATANRQEELVYVDATVWGDKAVQTQLSVGVEGDDQAEPHRQPIELVPGRTMHLKLRVPRTALPLSVRLGDDALAIDNTAILLPRPTKVIAVADLLPEETSNALRLGKVLAALPAVRPVEDPATAHVVFSHAPGSLQNTLCELVVAPRGEERDAWLGPFLLERRNVLLRGVTLEGVVWSAGPDAPPGIPLIAAGEAVLMTEERRGDAFRVHLNLDAARTNLAASPDWPIFLSNLWDEVRAALPGPRHTNVRVGEQIEYRYAGDLDALRDAFLVDPGGGRRPVRGLRTLTWEARTPGLHRLVAKETELARFSAHFVDPQESDLTPLGEEAREPEAAPTTAGKRTRDDSPGFTQTMLALLLLAAALADWFVLARARA